MHARRRIREWTRRHRITAFVGLTAIAILLAMAWTGKASWSSSAPSDVGKLPAVRTIGTEATAYHLAPLEREKLGSPPEKNQRPESIKLQPPVIWKKQSVSTIDLIPRDPGPEGLTPAERAKRTH